MTPTPKSPPRSKPARITGANRPAKPSAIRKDPPKRRPPERSGKPAQPEDPRISASSDPAIKHFTAILEPDHTSLKWTVARVPFDCAAVWPHMLRRRVAGTINGLPFRTSLFPVGNTGAQILLINKRMQAAAHIHLGDQANFTLWPDFADRPCELPPELLSAFDGDKSLHRWTLTLSDSMRREIGKWIDGVKSHESRAKRASQMAERLLLAMQGERETPPILEAAFRASPRARAGWLALTPYQRRGHLLGIFYYQTPEARVRRAEKAVAEALRAVERA